MSFNHHKSNYNPRGHRQQHGSRFEHYDPLNYPPTTNLQPPFVPQQQQQQQQQYRPVFNQLFLPQSTNFQQQALIAPELAVHSNSYQSYPTPTLGGSGISNNQRPRALDTNQTATEALNRLQLPSDQITERGIITNTPYYDLPAGIMIPLVAPEQREYKPLDPKELRLPLPKVPDENFLRAIDLYYGNDGKIRDSDGWDRGFIDTFIGQKEALALLK